MKRTGRCEGCARGGARCGVGGRHGARGFTLIELLVAIAILAVIAVLSWRGLDQIIRGRETITNAMEDERVFAQLFDQMRIDAREAVSDDEAGEAAVSIGSSVLQIVRARDEAGGAPRLQVVRYRIVDGRVIRYASPPLANVGALRRALHGGEGGDWNAVPLMGGVGSISARVYVAKVGWTAQMKDVQSAIREYDNSLKVPQLGNAPLPRAVTGLEVSVGAKSLVRPVVRVFLVGE